MKEIWKDIKDFERLYQVSNFGRVRSLKFGKERVLKNGMGSMDGSGYYKIDLCKNGKIYHKRIHRLVAAAFIDNPNNFDCINHINGIKTDNRVENLEWITCKENNIHAIRIGLKKEFTGKKKSIHCPELNMNFESINDAARYFNCHHMSIHHVLKGKLKQLHRKYTFVYA